MDGARPPTVRGAVATTRSGLTAKVTMFAIISKFSKEDFCGPGEADGGLPVVREAYPPHDMEYGVNDSFSGHGCENILF